MPVRGRGYWKLNVSLLKDNVYCHGITKLVQQVDEDPITANISMSYKWEVLKKRIKEYSLKGGVSKEKTPQR